MKKIFFYLCIVLLVLFQPAYSFTVKDVSPHSIAKIKHNQLYIPNSVQDKNLYFDVCLLEENNDNEGTSDKKKFSPEKNDFTVISAIAFNFHNSFWKQVEPTSCFLNFSKPDFIFFRALRL